MRILKLFLALPMIMMLVSCRTASPEPDAEAQAEAAWRKQIKKMEKEEQKRLKQKGELTFESLDDAKRLHALAGYAWDRQEYDEALRLFALLTARYGDSYEPAGAESHLALGDCFLKMKEYDKAAYAYKSAITGYPEGTRKHLGYVKLGDAYMEAGRHDRAFKAYFLAKILYKEFLPEDLKIEDRIKAARDAHVKDLEEQARNKAGAPAEDGGDHP